MLTSRPTSRWGEAVGTMCLSGEGAVDPVIPHITANGCVADAKVERSETTLIQLVTARWGRGKGTFNRKRASAL